MKTQLAVAAAAVLSVAHTTIPGATGNAFDAKTATCDGCGQAARGRAVPSFQSGALEMPPGFRDDDDDSSAPYVLSNAELARVGMKSLNAPRLAPVTPSRRGLRRLSVLKLRIHAIRTANSDGTEAATIRARPRGTADREQERTHQLTHRCADSEGRS
jgi:hypothetical protein